MRLKVTCQYRVGDFCQVLISSNRAKRHYGITGGTTQIGYEAELAVVIGKRVKRISRKMPATIYLATPTSNAVIAASSDPPAVSGLNSSPEVDENASIQSNKAGTSLY